MRYLKRCLFLAGLFCLAASSGFAETIFLKSGEEISGKILDRTASGVVVRDSRTGVLRAVRRTEIDLIVSEPEPAPPPVVKAEAPAVTAPTEAADATKAEPETGGVGQAPPAKAEGAVGTEGSKTEGPSGDEAKGPAGAAAGADGKAAAAPKEGAAAEGAKEEKEGEKEAAGPKLTPEEQKAVDEAMTQLNNEDPAVRTQGAAVLRKMGEKIIPALTEGLYHPRSEGRAECATMLGELGARNAVKPLIEAFYAAMPPQGQCATYNRLFVRNLGVSLAAVTGQTFVTTESLNPLVQDALQKYVEWYNANFDRLPPQVGEKPIKPTDPKYAEKLKKARELKLAKREWPRPPLSADIVTGEKQELPAGASTTRPQDLDYEKAFPKTDLMKAGGVIRPSDEKFRDNFFNRKDRGEE